MVGTLEGGTNLRVRNCKLGLRPAFGAVNKEEVRHPVARSWHEQGVPLADQLGGEPTERPTRRCSTSLVAGAASEGDLLPYAPNVRGDSCWAQEANSPVARNGAGGGDVYRLPRDFCLKTVGDV